MAKDPAVNWYFDNWAGGTKTMSRFLKGCYIDLLDAQFQSGHLSLEEIKIVLGNDFAVWGSLSKKFAVDETGKYYNERLEHEILKREKFSIKQSINGSKGGRPKTQMKPKQNPDSNPNESLYETGIETETGIENFGKSENLLNENNCKNNPDDLLVAQKKNNQQKAMLQNSYPSGPDSRQDFPDLIEVERVFIQQGGTKEMALAFFNRYEAVEWKIRGTPIKNFTPLVGTFITNWNANQNGKSNNTTGNKSLGTSEKRIAALKHWGSGA